MNEGRAAPQTTEAPANRIARWYIPALVAGTLVVFVSLSRYFLAQDDFVLLERGAFHPFDAVMHFFFRGDGQFRPLTKGVYFALAYRVFGLNAFGYHLISLALHIVNVVLTCALLRRLGVGVYGALTGATLFALSSAHFTVLAWASCIQQLLAMCLMLASMCLAIDAVETRRGRPLGLSLAAYAGALMCLEQTALLPAILTLIPSLGLRRAGTRWSLWQSVVALRWHWLLMGGYLVFMLFWKTLPDTGLYHPRLGAHVWLNAWTALARTMHYFVELPTLENTPEPVLYKANALLGAIIAYHLSRRRWREVVFGLAFFVACALPVLGLVRHAYYYQTYVLGLGPLFLVSLVAEDVYAFLGRGRGARVAQTALLAATLTVSTGFARYYVHRNETALFGTTHYLRSFVVRRSRIAREVYDGVMNQKTGNPARVIMFYGRQERAEDARWNVTNVKAALGQGAAFRLFYDNPDLDVKYFIVTDSIPASEIDGADTFVYDDFGKLHPPRFRLRNRSPAGTVTDCN